MTTLAPLLKKMRKLKGDSNPCLKSYNSAISALCPKLVDQSEQAQLQTVKQNSKSPTQD